MIGAIDMAALTEAPAAFLFDMDGLLLDTERMFLSAFQKQADEIGISAEEAECFFVTLVGTSSAETGRRLRQFLPRTVDAEQFEASWRQAHAENVQNGLPVKAHARDILQYIHTLNIPMAVVTSTHAKAARHHLQEADLLKFFQTVCAGDEVSANKPNPEPYLEGARRLGVEASQCVAFEDSDLGTTAAVAAGCMTVQVPDLRPAGMPLPALGQVVASELRDAAEQIGLFDIALT